MANEIQILDSHGQPIQVDVQRAEAAKAAHAVAKAYATYISALQGLAHPPLLRAQDPLENHAWVYAAAMAISMNLSQAPFTIYYETKTTRMKREINAKEMGREFKPRAGKQRTAVQRHLNTPMRFRGAQLKGVEADYEHPLAMVLSNANAYTTASQLWQATVLWLSLRGNTYWLKLTESGKPIGPGEVPAEIWVLSPDKIEPVYIQNTHVGWKYKPRKGEGFTNQHEIYLEPWEIVHFKYTNPNDPILGLAPIIPAAGMIKLDLLALAHNQAIIENGADPGGILTCSEGMDPTEENEFLTLWEQRNKGPRNRRKLNILTGDWKYIPTGMTPQEMDWGSSTDRNRDTVLAVMRTPKTVVGVTDALNYATQLGQDKNFWNKTILPLMRYLENVIDRELFFTETDNVFGAFDLSGIDALREGLRDQVKTARELCSQELHMPPTRAYELVGLNIEEYDGSDQCLVSPLLATVGDVMSGNVLGTGDSNKEEDKSFHIKSAVHKLTRKNTWKAFITRCHAPSEILIKKTWTKYVTELHEEHLRLIDNALGDKATKTGRIFKEISIDAIMLNVEQIEKLLREKIRPVYTAVLDFTLEYTVEEIGGIAVFDVTSPEIVSYFDKVQSTFVGTAPHTIQKSVRNSLLVGISNGETVSELRDRVSQVYKISSSHWKTLQVARTEASKFINGERDVMHRLQGIEQGDWVSAQDEATRDDHLKFDMAGPQPIGFNYMEVVGKPGILEFPGDLRAEAEQVINCRCVRIAVI
jgi:HK97 family phage portal protein